MVVMRGIRYVNGSKFYVGALRPLWLRRTQPPGGGGEGPRKFGAGGRRGPVCTRRTRVRLF